MSADPPPDNSGAGSEVQPGAGIEGAVDSTGVAPAESGRSFRIVPARLESAQPHRGDRWAHRRAEPRALAAIWLIYLIGVTALTVGGSGFLGLVATDVYRPSVRMLLVCAMVGVSILWPMIRLSQSTPDRIASSVVADSLVMVGPVLLIIAPLELQWMAAWPRPTVLALAATVSAWGILISSLLAVGLRDVRAREAHLQPGSEPADGSVATHARAAWMSLFAMVTTIGLVPALLAFPPRSLSQPRPAWMFSPLTGVWELTRDRSATGTGTVLSPAHLGPTLVVGGAGVLLWVFVLVSGEPALRRPRADTQQ